MSHFLGGTTPLFLQFQCYVGNKKGVGTVRPVWNKATVTMLLQGLDKGWKRYVLRDAAWNKATVTLVTGIRQRLETVCITGCSLEQGHCYSGLQRAGTLRDTAWNKATVTVGYKEWGRYGMQLGTRPLLQTVTKGGIGTGCKLGTRPLLRGLQKVETVWTVVWNHATVTWVTMGENGMDCCLEQRHCYNGLQRVGKVWDEIW